jgi:hypothetical protein
VSLSPPELGEITAYGAELGLPPAECEHFLDFYSSNNWKVGKNCMTDWRATLRNWKRGWLVRESARAGKSIKGLSQKMMEEAGYVG